ncbi:MAG: SDR family oxidoreductase [Armatimonadetes bacterium]|nr:SDR family oxidoreductase [Armatimonadota bacterium]MDE2205547.1 SDR family oxidoreductase [Armatimonadota bacterium]
MSKLAGKVAVVTGAGRGLGRAYARRLALLGANVVVNDINLNAAEEFDEILEAASVAAECELSGVKAIGVEADVTVRRDVDRLFSSALSAFGRVDILVNNAGGVLRPAANGKASQVSEDDWRFILDVNLTSTLFCCQAAAVPMQAQRDGSIINVSSQAGVRGNDSGSIAHYCVAKCGIVELTRLLAAELGPQGVRVNCIAPGLILTSRANAQFGRNTPENMAAASARIPLRRLGMPEDCAGVVEFLATDLSQYVTGQCIPVCGGMVLSPS